MTKEEQIKDWFMKEFWPTYPARFCSRKDKGSRAISLKHMLKHKPDEAERKRILANLKAQVRAAEKDPDRKWWKNGETYVYNALWEDEVKSMVEVNEAIEKKLCKCGQPVEVNTECLKCYDKRAEDKQVHMQNLKALGLLTPGLSLSELAQRCREHLRKAGTWDSLQKSLKSPES